MGILYYLKVKLCMIALAISLDLYLSIYAEPVPANTQYDYVNTAKFREAQEVKMSIQYRIHQ